MSNFRIAGVQMDVMLAGKQANLDAMRHWLQQTTAEGARLTVFPECALTGYCFASLEEAIPYAESVPGPATQTVTEWCRKLNAFVVFGLLERDGEQLFNACTLVGPEGVVGNYRKIHLPYLGVDRFTTSGDQPFAVHQAGPVRVGMNICYDGAFPESSRVMALDSADLIVLPTNWPPGAECTAEHVINTRALENHVYYLAVDRVGVERGFSFIGKSRLCAPNGDNLASADHTDPAVLYGDLDLERVRDKKVVRVPGQHEIHRFDDRRPEMYGRLSE